MDKDVRPEQFRCRGVWINCSHRNLQTLSSRQYYRCQVIDLMGSFTPCTTTNTPYGGRTDNGSLDFGRECRSNNFVDWAV